MGAILSLIGPTRTRIHFSSSPAVVIAKASRDSSSTETIKTSLRDIFQAKCPSILSFSPTWWLFNGHLQTLYCVVGKFDGDPVEYSRTYLSLLDGGTLGLDFTPRIADSLRPETPIIVVMHGLTGSYESYVRAILHPACKPVEEGGLGYRGVVMNFRGCAGVPLTSPQLYSAGETGDIRQALMYIAHLYPNAPLLGLGFSLGSNVLVRYCAEEGENSRLSAGCALACPWNLRANNDALNNTFIGRNVYSKGMGSNLVNLLKKHEQTLPLCDPHGRLSEALPNVMSLKNPKLDEFDDTFTRVAGGMSPPFPFATGNDYYDWGSSLASIEQVRVPFLCVNAADDPVVQEFPLHAGDNPCTIMALTRGGGHLGWFESRQGNIPSRWIVRPVLEWLQLMAEDLVHRSRGIETRTCEDGYLKQIDRDDLGCKVVDMVGRVAPEGGEGLLQGL